MKTIGILGGMGPASTLLYYETLCAIARERLGGNTSAKVLLHAFEFSHIQARQEAGHWDALAHELSSAATSLVRNGADMILLATNTMHKCAPKIIDEITVPFIHIADATAAALIADGRTQPALMGTRYTMEQDFYTGRLASVSGLKALIPAPDMRSTIQTLIFDELVKGIVTDNATEEFVQIANQLKSDGADSLILGCTEIGLVLNADNAPLPVYDTARIHCAAAMDIALT